MGKGKPKSCYRYLTLIIFKLKETVRELREYLLKKFLKNKKILSSYLFIDVG